MCQVVADLPHHHFPGVEAHPDAQLEAVGATHLLGIRAHGGLHGQGGVTGAQSVVLMGDGGAKQGHDAIAQHLVHCALVAVHGVHHVAQGGVQELLGGLGGAIPDQLGGVFDVSEQHRDLLAFAFPQRWRRVVEQHSEPSSPPTLSQAEGARGVRSAVPALPGSTSRASDGRAGRRTPDVGA